jgi:hypothetical protein
MGRLNSIFFIRDRRIVVYFSPAGARLLVKNTQQFRYKKIQEGLEEDVYSTTHKRKLSCEAVVK